MNAANVDPFLEGRRSRHLWSHQLRLRTATGHTTQANSAISTTTEPPSAGGQQRGIEKSVVESRGGRPIQTGRISSCLGPEGERALFESLSAGASGAFVAWVKGGHEIRQECKRIVTDVLDLLAAPRGQTEAFFQRGAQSRRVPRGRVGIAAKTTWAAPSGEKTSPSLTKTGGLGSTIEPENAENRVGIDGGPGVPRQYPPGGGGRGEPSAARHDEAANGDDDQGSVLKHSYASLRKIQVNEPLPKVRQGNVMNPGVWSRHRR